MMLALLLLCGSAGSAAFELPPFSWDTVPRFVHCGPDYKPPTPGKTRLPLAQVYQKMAQFPMATLEKFTLQTAAPANVREESKILRAAAEIRKHNTSTRIMFCACHPHPAPPINQAPSADCDVPLPPPVSTHHHHPAATTPPPT